MGTLFGVCIYGGRCWRGEHKRKEQLENGGLHLRGDSEPTGGRRSICYTEVKCTSHLLRVFPAFEIAIWLYTAQHAVRFRDGLSRPGLGIFTARIPSYPLKISTGAVVARLLLQNST